MAGLLTEDDQKAYTSRNTKGRSHLFFTCDHASPSLPSKLGTLGIDEANLMSHIGWDIGALEVSEKLSDYLDTPLISTNYSRLVIDCNRPPGTPDSIPERIHGVKIPGNSNLSSLQKKQRIQEIFEPYHAAISSHIHSHIQQVGHICFLAIHSFTPKLNGQNRPWYIGITYKTQSNFSAYLIKELSRNFAMIGENQPYAITPDGDYGIHTHGEKNNLPSVLMEIRQDLLQDEKIKNEIIENLSDILHWYERSLD